MTKWRYKEQFYKNSSSEDSVGEKNRQETNKKREELKAHVYMIKIRYGFHDTDLS